MLLGLMHAFDIPVFPMEVPLQAIKNWLPIVSDRYDGFVAKRIRDTLFSSGVSPTRETSDLGILFYENIQIIHVSRERDAVLASHGGRVSPARYDAVEKQVEKYWEFITLHLNYEDIIADPAGVQTQVAEEFDLRVRHSWVDYPDFVPEIVHVFTKWPPRKLGAEKGER
jgi:hypothetical protein